MPAQLNSGIRLFKIFGITVYLSPSWFIVAIWGYQQRVGAYHSPVWAAGEYLALFAIVLLHEFGHALACRSVGGEAERIVLWPLGGIAYVNPPMRPGAVLWSIVAGPLVNVALLPITLPWIYLPQTTDLQTFQWALGEINLFLLLFNLLPIYPLDGGKILWALLWFVLGRAKSLMVAACIGILGAIALGVFAIRVQYYWLDVLAIYAMYRAVTGFMLAKALWKRESLPRRAGVACPSCHAKPIIGPVWGCGSCQTRFDTFETGAICPGCGRNFEVTGCPDCGVKSPITAWGMPTFGHSAAAEVSGG